MIRRSGFATAALAVMVAIPIAHASGETVARHHPCVHAYWMQDLGNLIGIDLAVGTVCQNPAFRDPPEEPFRGGEPGHRQPPEPPAHEPPPCEHPYGD